MLVEDIRLDKCKELIYKISEDSIIRLYDAIQNYLFQNIHYERVISNMPMWVADAGCTPEVPISKEWYDADKQAFTHPICRKFIYYYDIWNVISALQDRLQSVEMFLLNFYSGISSVATASEEQYTSSTRNMGIHETDTHIALNSIFVALASAFDLFSKIAYEHYHKLEYGDFSGYSKMVCRKTLFNVNGVDVHPELKEPGMLFSPSKDVATIVTFRSEYVHNGPWDRRCSVYCTYIDEEPSDCIIYSPDIDEQGRFVSSGARNKFYNQRNRINFILPDMILSVLRSLDASIHKLIELYERETVLSVDEALTEECVKAAEEYYKSLK